MIYYLTKGTTTPGVTFWLTKPEMRTTFDSVRNEVTIYFCNGKRISEFSGDIYSLPYLFPKLIPKKPGMKQVEIVETDKGYEIRDLGD
jgi:hypothetical protein